MYWNLIRMLDQYMEDQPIQNLFYIKNLMDTIKGCTKYDDLQGLQLNLEVGLDKRLLERINNDTTSDDDLNDICKFVKDRRLYHKFAISSKFTAFDKIYYKTIYSWTKTFRRG